MAKHRIPVPAPYRGMADGTLEVDDRGDTFDMALYDGAGDLIAGAEGFRFGAFGGGTNADYLDVFSGFLGAALEYRNDDDGPDNPRRSWELPDGRDADSWCESITLGLSGFER